MVKIALCAVSRSPLYTFFGDLKFFDQRKEKKGAVDWNKSLASHWNYSENHLAILLRQVPKIQIFGWKLRADRGVEEFFDDSFVGGNRGFHNWIFPKKMFALQRALSISTVDIPLWKTITIQALWSRHYGTEMATLKDWWKSFVIGQMGIK